MYTKGSTNNSNKFKNAMLFEPIDVCAPTDNQITQLQDNKI